MLVFLKRDINTFAIFDSGIGGFNGVLEQTGYKINFKLDFTIFIIHILIVTPFPFGLYNTVLYNLK
jgi:hypothetical protein